MIENSKQALEVIATIAPAIAGGLLRYVHVVSTRKEVFDWWMLAAQIFTAAVVGYWVSGGVDSFYTYTFLDNPAFAELVISNKGSIVGVSSFLSPNILDFVVDWFNKKSKKRLED